MTEEEIAAMKKENEDQKAQLAEFKKMMEDNGVGTPEQMAELAKAAGLDSMLIEGERMPEIDLSLPDVANSVLGAVRNVGSGISGGVSGSFGRFFHLNHNLNLCRRLICATKICSSASQEYCRNSFICRTRGNVWLLIRLLAGTPLHSRTLAL